MKFTRSFHFFAFITIICWSLAYVFTRIAVTYYAPLSVAFLRYFIAAVALVPVALRLRLHPPARQDLGWFFAAGTCGFALYACFFSLGCVTVTAATASVIVATTPVITALLAAAFFRERLRPSQWAAIAISFAGVVVLTVLGEGLSLEPGLLWLLGASLVLSLFNLIQRRLTRSYSALTTSAYSIFCGLPLLFLFAPQAVGETVAASPAQWLSILILGVFSSALAYVCWAEAIARAERTSSVSNYMFLTPFLTALLGFLIAGEAVELRAVIGGAIIITGLLLFSFGGKSRERSYR